MEYISLGKSNLLVSRICYGTLTMSPLQASLSPGYGGELLRYALDKGINFLDTAEIYNNYPHIASGIDGIRKNFVIASKSYAYTYEGMQVSVHNALRELKTDYIDIFLLHEQESRLTLKGHEDALSYLIDARTKGIVRAVGVSTHTVEVVNAVAKMANIDVIHPIINRVGLGISQGSLDEMLSAISFAHEMGKGIYGMKPLGGGVLHNDIIASLEFVRDIEKLHSIAIGMQSEAEIDVNVAVFSKKAIPENVLSTLKKKKRRILIDYWCTGCAECTTKCSQNAMEIKEGKCIVDSSSCILCGYCASACEQFCIKII